MPPAVWGCLSGSLCSIPSKRLTPGSPRPWPSADRVASGKQQPTVRPLQHSCAQLVVVARGLWPSFPVAMSACRSFWTRRPPCIPKWSPRVRARFREIDVSCVDLSWMACGSEALSESRTPGSFGGSACFTSFAVCNQHTPPTQGWIRSMRGLPNTAGKSLLVSGLGWYYRSSWVEPQSQ